MRILCVSLLFGLTSLMSDTAPVGETRSVLQEWVLTEKTISQERESWVAEKATMNDLISLLNAEQGLLIQQKSEAEAVTTQAEERRGALLERKETILTATNAIEDELTNYEANIRGLQERLPAPLLTRIRPLLSRVPAGNGSTKLSVGQRAQNIVGILGEIDKFNREVTLDTQIQVLPDGRSMEVRVLYFGLGTAFYSDITGGYVGTLVPSSEGWAAIARPELSDTITEAIAQYERTSAAAFVSLPIEIQ